MVNATHATVGAAIAAFIPANPALAFSLALASHYAIDMIPHWDYCLKSDFSFSKFLLLNKTDKKADLVRIVIDVVFAVAVPTAFSLLLHISWWYLAVGAIFGVLPDILAFLITKEPWNALNRFHEKFHLTNMGSDKLCLITQSAIVAIVAFVVLNFAK